MSKIKLNNVTNPSNVTVMNDNFQKIEDELNEKVLYRKVPIGEPNQMSNDLDMNGKRIYNLPVPTEDHEPARVKDLKDKVVGGDYQRVLRVSHGAVTELGSAAERSNKFLSFDAQGNPQTVVENGSFPDITRRLDHAILQYDTLAEAEAAATALPDGQVVEVLYAGERYLVDGGLLLKRFNPEPVYVTSFGAIGDCSGVGEGTDNSSAFRAAIDYWISQGNFSRLVVPRGRFRLASDVVAQLNGAIGMQFEMVGSITPDTGVNRAISFINGRELVTRLKVFGGGTLADYTQSDPIGGTEAFYFRGIRGNDCEVEGDSYLGRVVRVTRQIEGEEKTSRLLLRKLTTGDISGTSQRCGQSIYCDDNGVADSQGAFGGVSVARTYWDHYGPVFEDLSDVIMGEWEGSFRNTGVELYGCQGVQWNQLYIGDTGYTGGNASAAVLRIKRSRTKSNRYWNRIFITQLKGLKTPYILDAEGVGSLDPFPSLWVGLVDGRGNFGGSEVKSVVRLNDVRRAEVNIRAYESQSALEVSGNQTQDIQANIIGRQFSGIPVSIGNLGAGSVMLTGSVRDNTSDQPLIKVDGGTLVQITMDLGLARNSPILDLSVNNNVKVLGGRISATSSATQFNNRPRVVRDVTNLVSENSGTATILQGTDRVTVNHGLFSTPIGTPTLTARSEEGQGAYVPTGITSTSFQIILPVVAPSDVQISWRAQA